MLRCGCWCDKATTTGAPTHARTLARCSPAPSAFHSVPPPGHPKSPTLSVVLVLPHLCALLWIPCRRLQHPTRSGSRIESTRMIVSLGILDKGPLHSKNGPTTPPPPPHTHTPAQQRRWRSRWAALQRWGTTRPRRRRPSPPSRAPRRR